MNYKRIWNLSVMIQNKLFRDCLAAISAEQKVEFDLSFGIAERISEILKAKGLTQKDFARLLNKRDSEISKWLTGRHNFTTQTIARIETALGSKLISIAHWLGYADNHILKHSLFYPYTDYPRQRQTPRSSTDCRAAGHRTSLHRCAWRYTIPWDYPQSRLLRYGCPQPYRYVDHTDCWWQDISSGKSKGTLVVNTGEIIGASLIVSVSLLV